MRKSFRGRDSSASEDEQHDKAKKKAKKTSRRGTLQADEDEDLMLHRTRTSLSSSPPPSLPQSPGLSSLPPAPASALGSAVVAAGIAMVSAGDGELQNKLKKWKQSADTSRCAEYLKSSKLSLG